MPKKQTANDARPFVQMEVIAKNNIRLTYDVEPKKPVMFLLTSDRHQDNPKCRQDMENRHLKEAIEQNATILDFGDLFCAMEGKGDPRGAKNLRPEHTNGCYLDSLWRTAADRYEAYASHWALMGQGNHEYSVLSRHETDLTSNLTSCLHDRTGHKIHAGGFANWVQIVLRPNGREKDQVSFVIYGHHGYGGGGPVNQDATQSHRKAAEVEGADLYLSGHTHDAWYIERQKTMLNQLGREVPKTFHTLKIPTYKDEFFACYGRGFHHLKGRGAKPLGAWWMSLQYFRDRTDGKGIRPQFSRAT